jgi:hypothetical protein
MFYESPPLSDGNHTLVVMSETDQALFWIDYISYESSAASGTNPLPHLIPQNDSTTPIMTASGYMPLSSVGKADVSNTESAGMSVGAIVGTTLGGMIALSCFTALFFLLFRRRKRNSFDTTADVQRPADLSGLFVCSLYCFTPSLSGLQQIQRIDLPYVTHHSHPIHTKMQHRYFLSLLQALKTLFIHKHS